MAYDSTFSFRRYLPVPRSNDMYFEGAIFFVVLSAPSNEEEKKSSRHRTHLIYIYNEIALRRTVVLRCCPCIFLDYTLLHMTDPPSLFFVISVRCRILI